MAIDKYNDSFFSKIFSIFDEDILDWTKNVYRKIKVDGILPMYIDREKSISSVDIINFTNSSLEEDGNFVWGYKKKPTIAYSYELDSYINIGRVHALEFEVEFNNSMSGSIISGSGDVTFDLQSSVLIYYRPYSTATGVNFSLAIDDLYHNIRIVRSNNVVSLYEDNIFIESKTLPSSEDVDFNFNRLSGGNFSTGQIKILLSDKVIHWWKGISNLDEGINSADFYTVWNSICFIFSLLYKYSKYLSQISSIPDLIRRFLISKGIYFPNNAPDSEVSEIYSNWQNEFINRGSGLISSEYTSISGICYRATTQDYGLALNDTTIVLGNSYTVEFDWKYDSSIEFTGEAYLITGINSTTSGSNKNLVKVSNLDANNITMAFYDTLRSISIEKDTILHKIKIVRSVKNYWIYLDEQLSVFGSELSTTSDNIAQGNGTLATATLIKGCFGKIANLRIYSSSPTVFNIDIPFNSPAYSFRTPGIYNIDTPKQYSYYGSVDMPSLDNLFTVDGDFNNVIGSGISGELLRLIGKQLSDEFILAYNSSIGWTINTSSPSQNQTYPIKDFNKLNKFTANGDISILPISYGGLSKEYCNTVRTKLVPHQVNNSILDGGTAIYNNYWHLEITPLTDSVKSYGISPVSYIQYDISKYALPISDNEDYEISFRLGLSDPNANIKFRPICYDATLNILNPISAIDGSITDTYFINVAYGDSGMADFIARMQFTLKKTVWIRGILHKKNTLVGSDTSNLNINTSFARNLIMAEGTTFIIPEILIESDASSLIKIYDLQIRPAKSNVDKGQLNTKNLFSLFCLNRSNLNVNDLEQIIDTNLIPVDSFIKIKELNVDNPFIDLNNYGYLYNSYAAETGNLAPDGWHVSTVDEWNTLISLLGGTSMAGGKLKESGTDNWSFPNTGATDDYNFTALPAGARNYLGGFIQMSTQAEFLTATLFPVGTDNVYNITMFYSDATIAVGAFPRKSGLSVRCVKDTSDWVEGETVTDIDGNIYKTVKIGDQVWMASNLRVGHYNDNGVIPEVIPDLDWAALTTGAWCTYNNEPLNKNLLSWDNSNPITWDNREVIEYE